MSEEKLNEQNELEKVLGLEEEKPKKAPKAAKPAKAVAPKKTKKEYLGLCVKTGEPLYAEVEC